MKNRGKTYFVLLGVTLSALIGCASSKTTTAQSTSLPTPLSDYALLPRLGESRARAIAPLLGHETNPDVKTGDTYSDPANSNVSIRFDYNKDQRGTKYVTAVTLMSKGPLPQDWRAAFAKAYPPGKPVALDTLPDFIAKDGKNNSPGESSEFQMMPSLATLSTAVYYDRDKQTWRKGKCAYAEPSLVLQYSDGLNERAVFSEFLGYCLQEVPSYP